MSRELTKKQRGFVNDIVKTGNGTKSVLDNYNTKSENTASSIATENLRKPKIQEAIKSIAESIPDSLLIKRHLEGLDSMDGFFPDYSVRHKYLDSAYKIKGTFAPENTNIIVLNTNKKEIFNKAIEYLNGNH